MYIAFNVQEGTSNIINLFLTNLSILNPLKHQQSKYVLMLRNIKRKHGPVTG